MDRAAGYGVPGHSADGTDLDDCLRVLRRAVANARAGGGPQLVVARLLRLCGHGEHDDASYVDPRLRQSNLGRDCIKVSEEFLGSRGWARRQDINQWRSEYVREAEELVARVQREGSPDPFHEEWTAISTERLRDLRGQEK